MLYNLFIRNKKRWIIFISTFIFILAAILIFNTYIVRKRYEEQTFKAQDYLESGNLKEAIEAYNVALSMKYGDKELLSLGLADAYARIHDYDRALEVLRNRYGVEQSIAVKEKIEEITIKKQIINFINLSPMAMPIFLTENIARLLMNMSRQSKLRVGRSYPT